MEVKGSEVAGVKGVPVVLRGRSSHHDVAAAVQGQVVGSGEGAVALGAAERLDPRVLAEVSGQLVGAGEAPGAALPGAVVRLLTWRGRDAARERWLGHRHQGGLGPSCGGERQWWPLDSRTGPSNAFKSGRHINVDPITGQKKQTNSIKDVNITYFTHRNLLVDKIYPPLFPREALNYSVVQPRSFQLR